MPYIYQEFFNVISQVNEEEDLHNYSVVFGIDKDYSWPYLAVSIGKYYLAKNYNSMPTYISH